MEQNSKSGRLHALDGLRGFAIIMVFLSHINATFINRSNLLGSYIFDSGVLGVTFLFILSGFLMAYLYPQPKNKITFIQKRYTRIFPLFLTMCTVIFTLKFAATNQWYIFIGVLIGAALFSHSIWIFVIKRFLFGNLTKIIFFAFIIMQILTGILYLWIMIHPAVFYYNQLSFFERSITNFFVNATLTLPIGRYVDMFDPVYWSLAAEVIFYILYPFICAPIIAYMSKKNITTKILLLICLIPLFVSITILSQHILYISLLRLQLFYYFVTGMTLGYLYRNNPNTISKIGKLFPGTLSYLSILLFFGSIFIAHVAEQKYQAYAIWISIFLAIPFTILVAISLSNNTALSKLFRSKILVYLGTISYSIYLCHMFILDLMIRITNQPNTEISTFFYILLTLTVTIIISSVLYFLLERPYFVRKYTEKKAGVIMYEPNRNIPILLEVCQRDFYFLFILFISQILIFSQ